jgi:hypothetical protein
MLNQAPTVQELQALITTLQAQVTVLQKVAPATQAAPAAAATQVVFANLPQTLGDDNIIDYSKKLGKDKRCNALDDKTLTDGFNMTPNKTVVFVEAFEHKAKLMGWSTSTKQITTFNNCDGVSMLTSSKTMAKLTWLPSRLHVREFARR